jgi:hypothetical protein
MPFLASANESKLSLRAVQSLVSIQERSDHYQQLPHIESSSMSFSDYASDKGRPHRQSLSRSVVSQGSSASAPSSVFPNHAPPPPPKYSNSALQRVPSLSTRPSITSSVSSQVVPYSIKSLDIPDVLLPSFPTSMSHIESLVILSATVMMRLPSASSTAQNPAHRSIGSFRSPVSKSTWSSRQLVLTSFKVSDDSRAPSPQRYSGTSLDYTPTSTEHTIAHLHIFSLPPQSNTPTRFGSMSRRHGHSGSISSNSWEPGSEMEQDRRRVIGNCSASFWEEREPGESKRCGMKILFGDDGPERDWVCDMPDR